MQKKTIVHADADQNQQSRGISSQSLELIGQKLTCASMPILPLLQELVGQLGRLRRKENWNSLVSELRATPIHAKLLEDPFTKYAFTKPRGYPGDAGLMDLIYGHSVSDSHLLSEFGTEFFKYSVQFPAAEAVRQRRVLAAHLIDDCCNQNHAAHIMSVACGHMRELELSSSFGAKQFHRLVGLDQDAISIAEVSRQYGSGGVEGQCAGVSELLKGEIEGKFDLIYSLGLFDYLQKPQARRLIAALVQQLNVGGRIVIANFLDDVEEAGYMEAFMDWFLIYRSLEAIEELIPRSVRELCEFQVYSPIAHIGVIDLRRRF